MLALGEFDTANYLDHPNTMLCFLLFLLATIFTQITMLNMLIAIMSDTFDKVTQHRDIHARKTKLELMGDYAGNFKDSEKINHFLFVVQVEEEE